MQEVNGIRRWLFLIYFYLNGKIEIEEEDYFLIEDNDPMDKLYQVINDLREKNIIQYYKVLSVIILDAYYILAEDVTIIQKEISELGITDEEDKIYFQIFDLINESENLEEFEIKLRQSNNPNLLKIILHIALSNIVGDFQPDYWCENYLSKPECMEVIQKYLTAEEVTYIMANGIESSLYNDPFHLVESFGRLYIFLQQKKDPNAIEKLKELFDLIVNDINIPNELINELLYFVLRMIYMRLKKLVCLNGEKPNYMAIINKIEDPNYVFENFEAEIMVHGCPSEMFELFLQLAAEAQKIEEIGSKEYQFIDSHDLSLMPDDQYDSKFHRF